MEDIRDPIFLCSEIIRVGKRGYIEVPSQKLELIKGVAHRSYCGYYHHRWLIDIKGNKINFRFKPHFIHSIWKYHLPRMMLNKMKEEDKVSFFFWKNNFEFAEIIQISRDKVQEHVYNFVKSQKAYPKIYYFIEKFFNSFDYFIAKLQILLLPNSYSHRYMDTPIFISK